MTASVLAGHYLLSFWAASIQRWHLSSTRIYSKRSDLEKPPNRYNPHLAFSLNIMILWWRACCRANHIFAYPECGDSTFVIL